MGLLPSRALLRWPEFGRKRFIAEEFEALVRYLREAGCSFHSCTDLGTRPVPRGISFRYDVHVRDLPGAFVFADLHRKHAIPATFFVFWDYSPFEREYLKTFLKLRERASPPLEIGLHDSPMDAHLIRHKFNDDRKAYGTWLDGSEAPVWFSHMSEAPRELEQLNAAALEDFGARVESTRKLFGPVTTVAGHGGEIGQKLRDRIPRMGAGGEVALSFFSRHWLTPERVRTAGLDAAVDCYGNFVDGWREFGCRGGAIATLAEKIRRYLSVRNSAIQLLLHPYTWTGAERDAEFSQALFVHGPPRPMEDAERTFGHEQGTAANPFWRALQARWPEPPSLAAPVSQLCTSLQFREPEYARLCTVLGEKPRHHRKQWEFAYILRCLEQAGAMGPGRRGLGFLQEPERLPVVFASQGCTVVATSPAAAGDAEYRNRLFVPLLDRALFDRRVTMQNAESSAAPPWPQDFDFCWSSSTASHAGSLEAGLQFIEQSLQHLKPGGVAVHIVEFNLESPVETVTNGPVVLYREDDLRRFAGRLQAQGHTLTLNLHPGTEADDLRVEPDNPDFHLKVFIQDVLSTSAGLFIRKAP